MKKLMALALSSVMVLGLAACGQKTEKKPATNATTGKVASTKAAESKKPENKEVLLCNFYSKLFVQMS